MIPSKRILVVDDEPVNQKLIENLLEVMGHSPEFANNGFEALEKIKSGFDLVLLDIRMPGIDGIEVVRRIRGNPESADIPIIMITVLDDKQTRIEAIQAGANDFINKPIDRLELQVRMESLLKMREAQNAIKLHLDELEKTVAERNAKLIESNELLKSELAERKHAEDSLRDSERKYRSLFDVAPIGIVLVDTEGKILEVNHFLLEILGSPSPEATKAINMLTFPPLVAAGVSRVFKDCMDERRKMSAEIPYTTKWGKQICLRAIVTPKLNEKGEIEGCQAVMEDITLRRQTELALKESEGRYKSMSSLMRLMCDNVPDLLWAKDLEGKAIFVNKAVCDKLLGAHDTEEPIGKTDYFFVERMRRENPQDPNYFTFGETCANSDAVVLNTMKPGRFDESGNVRGQFLVLDVYKAPFFNQDGTLIGTVGCGRDVTTEREAETEKTKIAAALRDSEQTLKTILSTSPVAITLIQDRKFIWTNEFGLKMFGYDTYEGYVGRDTSVIYATQDEYERVGREVYTHLATGRIAHVTAKLARKDGSVFDARIRTKLVDPLAPTNLAIAVITDITDDLRAEQEKESLQAQYLQAQKMEAIGNLAGGICHDFNNLLQIVLGYADVVLSDEELTDRSRANIQEIASAGERGADLIKRLLTFSRKVEVSFQPINMNDQVGVLINMLARTIPKMISIDTALASDLATINADPTQMDQVLMNLAVNARDAMHGEGKLSIKTANVILDDEYCKAHMGVVPGPYVMISVSDTGQGMDNECLGHIFEPFYTTKAKGKGTGLGLATVYGIVKRHNGFIDCESKPGHGATFKIYFPAVKAEEPIPVDATEEASPRGGTETILVVDDDVTVRSLMEHMLSRSGYNVLTAGNGGEALDLYSDCSGKISLVILDIIMPEMGGQECLRRIFQINPKAKILIATGVPPDDERVKLAIDNGVTEVMHKPVKYKNLLRTVRDSLDKV